MFHYHDIVLGLSQWSFHRAFFGNSRNDYNRFIHNLHSEHPETVLCGEMDEREFINVAIKLNVGVIDVVNILFFSHVEDETWLTKWKEYAHINGITFNCLMCDELGNLGASSESERKISIDLHKRWINSAAMLGCSMLRVNTYGDGTYLEQLKQNASSLKVLANYAKHFNIKIVVENHGHPSSNGAWLAMLMDTVALDNVGVYLDFDNFFMGGWNLIPKRFYDRQQGIIDLVPYTIGVSAKTYGFDLFGKETSISYKDCMNILLTNGFTGVISAEFEGNNISEYDGTVSTLDLIRKYL